ncbi:MAG TPA: cyclic nucleotide-binding domain-containing protein [Xanthomonadaceae bacterium]|nr:cyclic nucleotide-binding domain-containing protein [Xanthomonadaceae bacterium]
MVAASLFRDFVPTHSLHPVDRAELARHSRMVSFQADHVAFYRGEAAREVVYLVAGEVELIAEDGTRRVKAGSEEARHPLSTGTSHSTTATCLRPCELLFVDRDRLDLLLTWAQTGAVEVQELGEGDDGDWMSAMLRCPALHRVPPANIAQVIAAVESIEHGPDEVIVRQGAAGDFYYVLTQGQCAIYDEDANAGTLREIDRIGPGRGFGEEALLSGMPRNATVKTLSGCTLVRLSATDFARLLEDPLVHRISLDAVPERAVLVDVRLPEEYARGHLPGAVNVPLRALRSEALTMDASRPLAVYCDTGSRSASATFLFRERGFDAHLIDQGVPRERLTSRQELRAPTL